MEITPTNTTAQSTSNEARTTLADNYDTFLLLLTAQLENQDPLSPMDSTQFTEQLVQYSQVEQQIRTNDNLESLASQFQAASAGAALSYLGKTAIVEGATTETSGDGAQWSYEVDGAPNQVTLTVRNAAGRAIYETLGNATSGAHEFVWDGRDSNGDLAPAGTYTLDVEALNGANEELTSAIRVREYIQGVDFSNTTPLIITPSGSRDLSSVRAILDGA